jgi:serine protease Do
MWGLSRISLMAAFIIVLIPAPSLGDLLDDPIKTKASGFVVKIDGAVPGTGFIISKVGNKYTVLTAKHVVEKPSSYLVTAVDGQSYRIESSLTRKIPGIDLAEIEFTSSKNYDVAILDNSQIVPFSGKKVYTYGFGTASKFLPARTAHFLPGTVTGNSPKSRQGYSLTHTLLSIPGLSGSPILDENAKVIGVYGAADTDNNNGEITVTLGIPITTYQKSRQSKVISFRNNSGKDLICGYLAGRKYIDISAISKKNSLEITLGSGIYKFRCYTLVEKGTTLLTYFDVENHGIYDFFSLDVPCDVCPLSQKNFLRSATVIVYPDGKPYYTIFDREK